MNSIAKNTALVTGGLIFLGYCQYHFYYATFDIIIYNYISTPELLLSFFPVIISYIIPLVAVSLLILSIPEIKYRNRYGKDISDEIKKSVKVRRPLKLFEHVIFNKKLKPPLRRKVILAFLCHSSTISFGILIGFTISFWVSLFQDSNFKNIEGEFYLLSFIWLLFVIEPFFSKNASQSKMGRKYPNFKSVITVFSWFLIFLYFIFFSQKIKAYKVLNGDTRTKVHMVLNSKEIIDTDSSLFFIGRTHNYVFLRKVADSSNLIIQNSDIYKFVIKKEKNP